MVSRVGHFEFPDFSAQLLIDVDLERIVRGMSLRSARASLARTSPGRNGSTARSSGKNGDLEQLLDKFVGHAVRVLERVPSRPTR